MNDALHFFTYFIVIVSAINLVRMSLFLIGSDFYSLLTHIKLRRKKITLKPFFSVVIPAYNEEKNIIKAIDSVLKNNYPQDQLEVIVVNDGSTDNTAFVVQNYKIRGNIQNLKLISQPNSGKAHALNNGMKNYTKGELVMCLDADSYLSPDAINKTIKYFEDKKVMALAANTKIIKAGGFLNLIQFFEYTIAYQMKKALTLFNTEYIIGGVGSTFRKSFLEKIDYYDTNTVTEDIDLTMKILKSGNKRVRVVYGSDVVTYTQSVLSLPDLVRQRYRWKWGRYQAFLKNKSMFFSESKDFTKTLTHFYLPFVLLSDLIFIFEPIFILYVILIIILFNDFLTLLFIFLVVVFYIFMNLIAEETVSLKDKFKLLPLVPIMYLLLYVLSFVEYIVLMKSLLKIHKLKLSIMSSRLTWIPVKRY